MNSRGIIKRLKADGWFEVAQIGSHKQFKHPVKKGRVTVPHPKRDIVIGILRIPANAPQASGEESAEAENDIGDIDLTVCLASAQPGIA